MEEHRMGRSAFLGAILLACIVLPWTGTAGGAEPPSPPTAPGAAAAPADGSGEGSGGGAITPGPSEMAPAPTVRDPIEPVNRAIFVFNDRAYFWVMKPVAQGYRAVVPEPVRVSVRNFFTNLTTPIRLANNLFQGKVRDSGTELLRFTINSTIGIGGLFDPAKNDFRIDRRDEDLGRTLGVYGLGHGAYLVLPLIGPSSLRDAVGLAGDAFLDPVNYLDGIGTVTAVKAFKAENEISLTIGDYEDLKKSSVDPYIAVRDAYAQHRAKEPGK